MTSDGLGPRLLGAVSGIIAAAIPAAGAALCGALPLFVRRSEDWAFALLMGVAAGLEARLALAAAPAETEVTPAHGRIVSVLSALTGLVVLAASVVPFAFQHTGPPGPVLGTALDAALGLLLMGAGLALRIAAIATLGRQFNSANVVARGDRLETTGLYRSLAHPSELGLLLLMTGGLLLVRGSWAWLLLPLAHGLATARVTFEEKALVARHGATYRCYRRRTFDPIPSALLWGGGFDK